MRREAGGPDNDVAADKHIDVNRSVLHQERSYFGVHRVLVDGTGRFQLLTHGTTVHGAEHRQPDRQREPLTYYYRGGPLGQLFEIFADDELRNVAVIGLRAGSIACYRTNADSPMIFYEIDSVVVAIAANPSLFQFIAQCGRGLSVVLGDGRRQISQARPGAYDLLIVDAFSSDSVPAHPTGAPARSLPWRHAGERDGVRS